MKKLQLFLMTAGLLALPNLALAAEINKAVNEALAAPDARERLSTFGFAASPGPAQQVADLMKADRARYAEVLKRVKVAID